MASFFETSQGDPPLRLVSGRQKAKQKAKNRKKIAVQEKESGSPWKQIRQSKGRKAEVQRGPMELDRLRN
jgi:hypothetical protein